MGRYLPLELRIKLYGDVVVLRRGGLTYRGIIEEVWRRYGVRISKSSISEWLRGVHSQYNGKRIPSLELLEPSEELAYVIDVVCGDGSVKMKRRIRKGYNELFICLEVKDKEFAEEFGRRAGMVLGREPYKPSRKAKGIYYVEVGSKTLYELLKKPIDLNRIERFVEHRDECAAMFLRGFFDSEGSVSESGAITATNTNYELLDYIKDLLWRRFNIVAMGPKPLGLQGKIFYCRKRRKTLQV